jgi:UDP-N-acetylglucosamine 2-epimerase (non-hydrolysing)
MKIINVVGARPNFIKIAPIVKEMKKYSRITSILLHTGQHYDYSMSKDLFYDLDIPEPDINLEVGSGSHAQQTAKIMIRFEEVLLDERPDVVLVVGDVNSTLACAITAKKLCMQVAHVEAGLRSRDMSMPEEINRMVTDVLADYLFTTSEIANANLRAEGISDDRVYYVGNSMIDTLLANIDDAEKLNTYATLGFEKGQFVLLTMHRPSNVDNKETLDKLLDVISAISMQLPVIFPAHPRTRMKIEEFGLSGYINEIAESDLIGSNGKADRVKCGAKVIYTCSPLGYKQLLNLNMNSRFVITDSGGIQEETTVCGVPCLTIRENTERPETVTIGTNVVVGTAREKIMENANLILAGKFKEGRVPDLWDGKTAGRIVEVLVNQND